MSIASRLIGRDPESEPVTGESPDPSAHPSQAERRRRVRNSALQLGFELLVIFIGISAAFAAENYRETLERRSRARQFYSAILTELDVFIGPASRIAEDMSTRIQRFEAQRSAGGLVVPPFYREPNAERPPSAVWDASLMSGATLYVKPELFFELARLYNHIRSIGDRYQRYNTFTEGRVLPNLQTPRAYYDARDSLLGEYSGHVQRLGEIRDELVVATQTATRVRGAIQTELQRLGGSVR
jgi:hypothetical protein